MVDSWRAGINRLGQICTLPREGLPLLADMSDALLLGSSYADLHLGQAFYMHQNL